MSDKPKPYRTRHKDLNDAAIGKMKHVRKLMVKLIRHIQPRDEAGMKLTDQIADLFLSALTDMEEERQILDNGGVDVVGVEQSIADLHARCQFLEKENERHWIEKERLVDRMQALTLRLDIWEQGVPVDWPGLNRDVKKS